MLSPHVYCARLCGCGVKVQGEHRATLRSEVYERQWLMRREGAAGEEIIECGGKWQRTAARLSTGPTTRVLKRISEATTLAALGKTYAQAAQALGVEERTINRVLATARTPCKRSWAVAVAGLAPAGPGINRPRAPWKVGCALALRESERTNGRPVPRALIV